MSAILIMLAAGCGLQSFQPVEQLTDTGAEVIQAAGLTVSPGAIDFGTVPSDQEAQEQVVIHNHAGRTLVLASAEIDGDAAFWLDSVQSFPTELADEDDLVLTVGFSPDAGGPFSGTLDIAVSGEEQVAQVSLSGTGEATGSDDTGDSGIVPDGLSISPASVDFGQVYTNNTPSIDLTVTNNGTASVLIESMTVADSDFSLSGEIVVPQLMNPGTEKTLTVKFAPSEVRVYSDTLLLQTDLVGVLEVPLAGEGLEPLCTICQPTLSVDAGDGDGHSMSFFSLLGIADTQSITLRNNSDVDLTISAVSLNNDSQGGTFSQSGLSPTTIGPWGALSAQVSYTCSEVTCLDIASSWTDENILHIVTDDPSEPDWQISLSGL